jgi:hypothetical protein
VTAPVPPEQARDGRRKAAERRFDAMYRRCHEHNRARYWCGCYYADAAIEALRGEGR